jgi:hypothetical protein
MWREPIKLGLIFLAAATMLSRSSACGGVGAEPGCKSEVKAMNAASETVTVGLQIDTAGKRVKATLNFVNDTAHSVFLDKINACVAGKIANNVFELKTDSGPISYSGILAKRRRPGPEDFVKVEAGKHLTTTVYLEEAYKFLPGTHRYKVRYSALHNYPDKADYFELTSNEVSFTFAD